jgi:H/ACA ribonucleoprotein complex non-core subunit NAF1
VEFGTVTNYIDDGYFASIMIVKPHNPLLIYDLDNIVAMPGDKAVVGFILDLVGHVTAPLYSIRLYPSYVQTLKSKGVDNLKNQVVDQMVCLVKKCLKVINAELPDIMNKKGCDASNIYDEEIPEHEQEYSDDEKEKAAKKARKNKLKRKAGGKNYESDSSSDEEQEEGEIKSSAQSRKQIPH